MRHYDSINRLQDDGSLMGEMIWAFNKLDGQNFGVKYNPRTKKFGPYCSRKRLVDASDDQFGECVKFFENSCYREELARIVKENSGKKQLFTGAEEITFYFEWYGEHSFAGVHDPNDEMHLALIDVFIKKKGYIEPDPFIELFGNNDKIETPFTVYHGPLDQNFIRSVKECLDYDEPLFPGVKEGVVCRRTTQLKGQRMPKVKIKTNWWINELHKRYTPDKWDELE